MLNISTFLSHGETSLFSSKKSLLRNFAAALIIPIAIGALTACSTPAQNAVLAGADGVNYIGASTNAPAAEIHTNSDGKNVAYAVDGNSLALQAMLDPSLKNIRVASSTSGVLHQFISNLPSSLKATPLEGQFSGETLGTVSAEHFGHSLYEGSPDGVAYATHRAESESVCIVLAVGLSRKTSANGEHANYVDYSDSLYVSSGGVSDVATIIHESTHCLPNTVLALDDQPLSVYYESSVRELRSDLAVVLYGASQTGSFEEGLDMITALRGATPQKPSHATVGMLETVTNGLNAQPFKGMPVDGVIAAAVKIVNDLSPASNSELRLAYAKDAWTYRSIKMGGDSNVRSAPSNYARFGGQPFTVDLAAHANKVINRSLNNAISEADVIRQSKTIPVSRVEAFARDLGVTLSAEQRAKAEFVDGSITPPGTQVSNDGAIAVKVSAFSLAALEARVQGELKTMAANGLIRDHGASKAAAQIDAPPKAERKGESFITRSRDALMAIGSELVGDSEEPSMKVRGPSM